MAQVLTEAMTHHQHVWLSKHRQMNNPKVRRDSLRETLLTAQGEDAVAICEARDNNCKSGQAGHNSLLSQSEQGAEI